MASKYSNGLYRVEGADTLGFKTDLGRKWVLDGYLMVAVYYEDGFAVLDDKSLLIPLELAL